MDAQKTIAIKELNLFLKGEYMAIDSYKKYINKLQEPLAKAEFQYILQDHKSHAHQIINRIIQLGGKAAESVGIKGKIGELINTVKNINKNSTDELCRIAYYWEDQGIKMGEEVIKGDLDEESERMIRGIISKDKSHLNSLRNHFTRN